MPDEQNPADQPQGPQTFESVDTPAQYIGQNGLAPAYTPGSDISSATGQPSPQAQPGALKRLLLNMAQGASLAGQYHVGIPQAQALQQQTQEAQAQAPARLRETNAGASTAELNNQLLQRRLDAIKAAGNNQSTSLGNLSPDEQSLMSAAQNSFLMTGDPSHLQSAIQHITGVRALSGRQLRSDSTVTDDMVQQYPALKPFLGKPITPSQMASISRGEAINNVFANTASGPVVVPKSGPDAGVAKPVTLDGKGIQSLQQAGAYWQAKYGVVKTQDENGPVYTSRLNAQGAPTDNNAFNIFKGKAGLDNFKDALTRVSNSLDVLDDPSQRALVAQTLRNIGTQHDPGIVTAIVGNAVSGGLDPKAADLVAATLNAREWIGSNRAFAGNFQGSEALYNRMVANVAGPLNSPALNRALVKQDLDNTSKIEGKIGKFTTNRTPDNPKGGGFWDSKPVVNP